MPGTDWILPNPYQTHFHWVGVAFANHGDENVNIEIVAYKNGEEKGSATGIIEPKKKGVGVSQNIWSNLGYADIDMILIHTDKKISPPISIIGNNEQSRHVFFPATIIPTEGRTYRYYIPHIPDSPWETTLTAYNPKPDHTSFSFYQYDKDGIIIENSPTWGIGGYSTIDYSTLNSHFQKGGIAYIDSYGPIVFKLSYRFGESESINEFMLSDEISKRWIVPNTIKDWFAWFGLAAANFNTESNSITFTAYKNGTVVGTDTQIIDPNKKMVALSNTIWDSGAKAPVGYQDADLAVVESDKAIPNPLSISGNDAQTRHVSFKGQNMDNNIFIPDVNLKAYLVQEYDLNGDGEISYGEAAIVNGHISIPEDNGVGNIADLEGIQYFLNIQSLNCFYEIIENVPDISALKKVRSLFFSNCLFTQLPDLSELTALEELYVQSSELKNMPRLPVSLKTLNLYYSKVETLDLTGLINLMYLNAIHNNLTNFDSSSLPELLDIRLNDNENLATANISGCSKLNYIGFENGQLEDIIGLSSCTTLEYAYINNNKLTSLDLSNLLNLKRLDCNFNDLTILDVPNTATIYQLNISYNPLTSFDTTGLTGLVTFYATNTEITSLDVSGLTNLNKFQAYASQLTSISVIGCTNLNELNCQGNNLEDIPDVSTCINLKNFYCHNNNFDSGDCAMIQTILGMGLDNFQYNPQKDGSTLTCP